ncbi:putative protein kinase RLK-Pelle-L-LEC family [Helianthus annuus]|nr:putative protein kinase RLK-Pelle-L-LEC family [Helianthus annuus]
MFEILCGRDAGDRIYLTESKEGLVHVARRKFCNGTLEDIIDPTLKEETGKKSYSPIRGANKDSLYTFSKVANQCVAESQDQRPTMKVVLNELEQALVFQEEQVQEPNKDQVVDELHITTFQVPGKNLQHLKIQLSDINMATHNFSDTYETDSDIYHTWYTTELGHFDKEKPSSTEGKSKNELPKRHNTVEIKRFFPRDDRLEELFFTELEMLSSVKHHNIVTLIGFCVEDFELLLVIEKITNRYLDHYLGNINEMRIFTWEFFFENLH